MASYNKFVIMGRITRDIDSQYLDNGIAIAKFSVAVDRNGQKDRETGEKITDFFDVVAWRKTAEFATEYLGKGRLVLVEGQLQTRTYEKDGVKRKVYELHANAIQACGDRPRQENGEGGDYEESRQPRREPAAAGSRNGSGGSDRGPAPSRPAAGMNFDDDDYLDE